MGRSKLPVGYSIHVLSRWTLAPWLAYIAYLSVMSAPCVYQLPFAVFVIPNLHSMVGRRCQNAVAIEIKLRDGNQVAVARVEVGESRHFAGT